MDASLSPKLRNARACESCRASKSKCTFRPQSTVCQKCEQHGGRCIVRTKARPMRTRNARTSANAETNPHPSPDSNDEFSLDLPSVTTLDTRKGIVALHSRHKHIFNGDEMPVEEPDLDNSRPPPKHLAPRTLSLKDAESLLSIYRTKAPFFPFVPLPEDATIPSLARNAPFLLLAILASGSIGFPRLYHQIDHEFRRVLSSKVIVEGQKSLDFLQGLLIYIAWYPIHSNPKNNQSFMYMNLAISLVTDLGLDRNHPTTNNFTDYNMVGLHADGAFTAAAKRAYLGCYYLSSALSMGFQKPNNLQYRNLMDAHGRFLIEENQATDIYILIKSQHLMERIAAIHAAKQPGLPHVDAVNVEMNAQMFLNELQSFKDSTPDAVRSLSNVGLAERFAHITIYSHELGFLRRPYHSYSSILGPGPAMTLILHLHSCLSACKAFFEYLLSLPAPSFHAFAVVQWGELVQALVVLSRLTFVMAESLGWDEGRTRAEVPLGMYLDCLCYRMLGLSGRQGDAEGETIVEDADVFWVMMVMLKSVRKSYERRVSEIRAGSFAETNPSSGHCPIRDPSLSQYFVQPEELTYNYDHDPFVSPKASTYGGSWELGADGGGGEMSAESGLRKGMEIPVYHNIWATMTCSWADEM
ncbi:hypothetical protein BJ875DRAFT_460185 [Amylocarpus encephaloides]|uniref:Zn(2)-C6 fungal-type domain-containing protein n=1 Tax=Amylocarpus encephaloides TaxID=45428 RepID=A0A9P7YJJ5_9HELO|nr:hypothetical protein BJ875DRAFT_460185 [Amylocarpus encephaloides]